EIDSTAAQGRAVQVTSKDPAGFADVVEAVKPAVIGVRAGVTQELRGSRNRTLPDSHLNCPRGRNLSREVRRRFVVCLKIRLRLRRKGLAFSSRRTATP